MNSLINTIMNTHNTNIIEIKYINNIKLDYKIKYDKKYNNKIKYNKNRNKYPIKDTYRK